MKKNIISLLTPVALLFCSAMLTSCSSTVIGAEQKSAVTSKVVLEATKAWNGDEMPAYPKGKPKCTILHITVAPHSKLDVHKHPMMNAGVILKGELHVVDDAGREITLKEGDPIMECVGRMHYGENLTDAPVELLMFYAGAEGQPLSVYQSK